MKSHSPILTEEMKTFLQEGLEKYAPALLALSEFRRQVGSKLQAVLDESSSQFLELGLSVADLKAIRSKIR